MSKEGHPTAGEEGPIGPRMRSEGRGGSGEARSKVGLLGFWEYEVVGEEGVAVVEIGGVQLVTVVVEDVIISWVGCWVSCGGY